jgi:hypothetical protein
MNEWARTNIDISNCFADPSWLDGLIQDSIDEGLDYNVWTFRKKDEKQFFTKEWIEYLEDAVGLKFNCCMSIYRNSGYQHRKAHVDISGDTGLNDRIFALNWTYTKDDDALMRWYKLVDYDEQNMLLTPAGTPYLEWNTEVDGLEESGEPCCIGDIPTLCRVDAPHDIEMGQNRRASLSIRFDRVIKTWDEALEHFASRGLL